jgi:peptidoglycan/xylan/chitin deacetylase (PgdA/CDA1 family)
MKMLPPNYWPSYLRANRLRILMYHGISKSKQDRLTVTPDHFAAEMRFLAQQQFQVISLQDACRRLNAGENLEQAVVLTFDDGLRDFLLNAAPVLRRYQFTATLFVVTGRIGSTSAWSSNGKNRRLLNREELQQLRTEGFNLGSHTVTHQDLRTLDETRLEQELNESRAAIAGLGESFIPFAYPGGTFTARERDAVERAGYDCGVIVGGRWGNGPETDRFLLKREPMLASDSFDWFKKRVNGFYEAHYLMARARGVQTR